MQESIVSRIMTRVMREKRPTLEKKTRGWQKEQWIDFKIRHLGQPVLLLFIIIPDFLFFP